VRKGNNLIAIGDIHGMAQTLELLLSTLTKEFKPENTRFVFLGDLIDRGPNPFKAVDLVCDVIDHYPGSVCIRGNHDMYMDSMSNLSIARDEAATWMCLGGKTTIESYGLDPDDLIESGKTFNRSQPRHMSLFRNARSYFETQRYYFTHAGVDPTVPLSEQDNHVLMWIRKGFLDSTTALEKIVVHGHTITGSTLPEIYENRVALDVGSYRTDKIAAAIFVDDELDGFFVSQVTASLSEVRRFDKQMNEI
jgi:serine/threonine protein phosphatase 1